MKHLQTFRFDAEELFTQEWTKMFCTRWNSTDASQHFEFRNMDSVAFEVQKSNGQSMVAALQWDPEGFVSTLPVDVTFPRFISDIDGWNKYMFDRIGSVTAVLSKLIIYRGPVIFAISNGAKFDILRDVAASVSVTHY